MRTLEMIQPGDASVLSEGDREIPTPGDGQIRIRVVYAGLNFTDVLARRGVPGYASAWPFVPGMEVSGTIDAIGPEVTSLAVGDRVVALTPDGGGYAEFVLADSRLAVVLPSALALELATGVPLTWATALGLTRRANVRDAETILVTSAAGGVGAALAAVLRRHKPTMLIGGVGDPDKVPSTDYTTLVRDPGFLERAVAMAGKQFDVILDSLGGAILRDIPGYLDVGGCVVSYGAAAGGTAPGPPTYAALRGGNHTISGFSILNLARKAPGIVADLIRDVIHDWSVGTLSITRPDVIEWADLIDAHVRQSDGRAVGKVIVAVGA